MAQTEYNVRVLGQNKFDLSIDSVKYDIEHRQKKTWPHGFDQVRHKHGSATTCGTFYKLFSENKGTDEMSIFFIFLSVLVKP